jgi:hypothetical protein
MKKILFSILSVALNYCSWGQVAEFSEASLIESQTARFDTTYFENGEIETISRQPSLKESTLRYKVREIKTVYQYDMCGHLRNTTIILEDNDPMSYGIFGPRTWQEDKLVIGAACDFPWVKPLIF